jgi:hypothetical protein
VKVFATLPVEKRIAEQLKHQPAWVQECISKAEDAMNVTAGQQGRKVAERPRLVEIVEPTFQINLVELRFEAETRSI